MFNLCRSALLVKWAVRYWAIWVSVRPDFSRTLRTSIDPASHCGSSAPGSPPHQAPAAGSRAAPTCVLLGGIARPIHALGHILSPAAATVLRRAEPQAASTPLPVADVSHHSPCEVLRTLKELHRLHIERPTFAALGIQDGVLLKWKADFGSILGSCVILGASSVSSKPPSGSTEPEPPAAADDSTAATPDAGREPGELGSLPDLYTNGAYRMLRRRGITCCNRESLDMTDADERRQRGCSVLTMDKRQLQDLRVQPVSALASSHRILMPALSALCPAHRAAEGNAAEGCHAGGDQTK
ncbi:hypothetical protein BS78_01G301400 [Paspalum vaginatum]|nr:hypothetical protein BS78_01G301400 [Paspalum vaginatum]